MIKQVNNKYHVSLKTDIIQNNHIKKITEKSGKYFIEFDNINKTYKYTKELCNYSKCTNIKYNKKLLSLYGIGKNSTLQTFKTLLLITILILGFSVGLIIYNSFSLTFIERKKQIGILKSIGLANIQLIKMNLLEGIILLIISFLIGTIISFWLVQNLIVVVNYLLKGIFTFKLAVYQSFLIMAVIFIIVLVFICILIPSLSINKLSTIEMIKGTNNYRVKKIKKKFNLLKKIAYYNYYRCKKKYRPIVFCVFISISLFAIFSLYLNYGLSSIKDYSANYNYQIIIKGSSDKIKEFSKGYSYKMCETDKKIPKENFKEYYNKKMLVVQNKNDLVINKLKTNGIYRQILKQTVYLEDKKIKTKSSIPLGLETYLENNIVFLTKDFDKYCPNFITSYFITTDIPNFENKLSRFAYKHKLDISYVNVKKAKVLTNNFILALKITLYSLVILMALTALTTLISTCEASLELRMSEMATLNSVGITKKQINKILRKETNLIIRKAFIISLIFILLIDYILYYSVKNIMTINFVIPCKEIIVSFIISYLLVYSILKKGYKKINTTSTCKYINKNSV